MRKRPKKPTHSPAKAVKGRRLVLLGFVGIVIIGIIGAWARWHGGRSSAEAKYIPRPQGQITFNKDIAPIVFEHCAGCHRPGQSAPFSLLSYLDVKKHAEDIADVTSRRFMPPWLPEQGYGKFAGERRLSVDQIGVIQQWVADSNSHFGLRRGGGGVSGGREEGRLSFPAREFTFS